MRARVDGRAVPATTGVRVSIAELALFLVLAVLVLSVSIGVLS